MVSKNIVHQYLKNPSSFWKRKITGVGVGNTSLQVNCFFCLFFKRESVQPPVVVLVGGTGVGGAAEGDGKQES